MKLFGTDGIRGKFGEFPMDLETISKIISGFFKIIPKKSKIAIGMDTRISGPEILNIILNIAKNFDHRIENIGIVPTPIIGFLTEEIFDYGIMISASHNPYYDNGLKFFQNGQKISSELETKIEKQFDLERNQEIKLSNIENIQINRDFINQYIEKILEIYRNFSKDKTKDIKIAIDCANGATYQIAERIFAKTKINYQIFNSNPNGYNINENCGSTNIENLQQIIQNENFDLGIAFDGDGDRIIICSKFGIINGDLILGILSRELKITKCVGTIISNFALERYLSDLNIQLFRSDVGDKNVIELMQKEKILLGGESSGHIIINKFLKTGDGILCAIILLGIFMNSQLNFQDFFHPFKMDKSISINLKYNKSKYSIEEIEKICNNLKSKYQDFSDRVIVRKSGTESIIRIIFEGNDLNENKIKLTMNEEIL